MKYTNYIIAGILSLILGFLTFTPVHPEDIWVDHNPYHPLSGIPEGAIIKIMVDEPVSVEYEYEASSDEGATIKMTPDKGIMNFLPKADTEKSITGKEKVRIRARGRVRFRVAVSIVGAVKNGTIQFQGNKSIAMEAGKAEQLITMSGRVNVDDISSDRTVKSSDVADLVIRIKGIPVPEKKNITMKTETSDDPNAPVKKSAKISDDEKQQMLLDYINRVLGEAGME